MSYSITIQPTPYVATTSAAKTNYFSYGVNDGNFLVYSEDFTNSNWSGYTGPFSLSATSILTPTGATTAYQISASTSVSQIVNLQVDPYPITYSLYVHVSSTATIIQPTIWFFNNPAFTRPPSYGMSCSVKFDPKNGNYLGSVGDAIPINYSSKYVGNGWYRYSVTTAQTSGLLVLDKCECYYQNFNNAITPVLTASMITWGWQLEQNSSVGPYIKTENSPVIPLSYNNFVNLRTVEPALGLPIRTNLLTYSQNFSTVNWQSNDFRQGQISATKIFDPLGTNSYVYKLYEQPASVGSTVHEAIQSVKLYPNYNYTLSVYAKAAELNQLALFFNGFQSIVFDLSSQTINIIPSYSTDHGTPSGTITSVGGGWYHCTYTANTLLYNPPDLGFGVTYNGTGYSYQKIIGDGRSGIYIWGAQLEKGLVATPYIATSATNASSLYPPFYTNVSLNKPYYFLLANKDYGYNQSRGFTGNDTIVFNNNKLGYNNNNPVYNLDINGTLGASYASITSKISTNNISNSGTLNVNNFNRVNIYSNISSSKIIVGDTLNSNGNVFVTKLTSVSNISLNKSITSFINNVLINDLTATKLTISNLYVNNNTVSNYISSIKLSSENLYVNDFNLDYFSDITVNSLSAKNLHGKIDIDPTYFYYNTDNNLTFDNSSYTFAIKPSDPYSTDDFNVKRTLTGNISSNLLTSDNINYTLKPFFKTLQGVNNYIKIKNLYGNTLNVYLYENIIDGEQYPKSYPLDRSGQYGIENIPWYTQLGTVLSNTNNLTGAFYSTEWLGTNYPELTTAGILGGQFWWTKDTSQVPYGFPQNNFFTDFDFKNVNILGMHEWGSRVSGNTTTPPRINGNLLFTVVYPLYCVVPAPGSYVFSLTPTPVYGPYNLDDTLQIYVDGIRTNSLNLGASNVTMNLTGSHQIFLVYANTFATGANFAFKPPAGVNLYSPLDDITTYVGHKISEINITNSNVANNYKGLYYHDKNNTNFSNIIVNTGALPSNQGTTSPVSAINFSSEGTTRNNWPNIIGITTPGNVPTWSLIKPFDQASPTISYRSYQCANSSLVCGNFGSTANERVSNWTKVINNGTNTFWRPNQFGGNFSLNMKNLGFEFLSNHVDNTALWLVNNSNTTIGNVTIACLGTTQYNYSPIILQTKNYVKICGDSLQLDPYVLDPNIWNNQNWLNLGYDNPQYYPSYGLAIVGNKNTNLMQSKPSKLNAAIIARYEPTAQSSQFVFADYDQYNRKIGYGSQLPCSLILDGNINGWNLIAMGRGRGNFIFNNQILKTPYFNLSAYQIATASDGTVDYTGILNTVVPIEYDGYFHYANWYDYNLTSWNTKISNSYLINTPYNSLVAVYATNGWLAGGNFNTVAKTLDYSGFMKPVNSNKKFNYLKGTSNVNEQTSTINYVDPSQLYNYDTLGLYKFISPLDSGTISTMKFYQPTTR